MRTDGNWNRTGVVHWNTGLQIFSVCLCVCAYLEQVSSLTTCGRAERSYWAESAPEVDVGQQRTGGQQQGGSLTKRRRVRARVGPIHSFMENKSNAAA